MRTLRTHGVHIDSTAHHFSGYSIPLLVHYANMIACQSTLRPLAASAHIKYNQNVNIAHTQVWSDMPVTPNQSYWLQVWKTKLHLHVLWAAFGIMQGLTAMLLHYYPSQYAGRSHTRCPLHIFSCCHIDEGYQCAIIKLRIKGNYLPSALFHMRNINTVYSIWL